MRQCITDPSAPASESGEHKSHRPPSRKWRAGKAPPRPAATPSSPFDPGLFVGAPGLSSDGPDWESVRTFLAAARARSFSDAAKRLGVTQPTISRRIDALERLIGTPLFQRTKRGAELTDAGRDMLAKAEDMNRAAVEFNRSLMGLRTGTDGPVRIGAGEGVVGYLLSPAFAELQGMFPSISLHHVNRICSFPEIDSSADIFVVYEAPGATLRTNLALKVKRLGRMTFVPFSSAEYLADYGEPRSLGDLQKHRLVTHESYVLDPGLAPWNEALAERAAFQPGTVWRVASTGALHRSVASGLGIGLLPTYSRDLSPDLVRLNVGSGLMQIDLWLAAHEQSLRAPRVQSVFDLIGDYFHRRQAWFCDRPDEAL